MNKRLDEAVAARAYQLWEKAGKPEGRDEEFWRLAEQELINEDKGSPLRPPTRCDQPGGVSVGPAWSSSSADYTASG
ncbi:DUF2934 domain-containing protein [Bradyrhizobium sp. Arg62]|uniref:DUF2934 domain-containing protein n=1 Tax=Bradyrhizobium brasilense TaxID=1419277 RepID=UPI003B9690CD|nr:DUF2934 domain-containing protein [Bradyrhizobium brasilense]